MTKEDLQNWIRWYEQAEQAAAYCEKYEEAAEWVETADVILEWMT